MIAQIDRFILRDQRRGRFHICVRQLVAVAHQCRQLTDYSVDLLQTGRIAIYQQFVPMVRMRTLKSDSRCLRFSS